MRRLENMILVVSMVTTVSGCSTLAKRAVKEVRGARSEVALIPGTVSDDFGRFRGVDISPPHSELGALVPAEFNSALRTFLDDFLSKGEEAPFPGSEPVLRIDPQVQWYHRPGGLGSVLGSDSYAVVLFSLQGNGSDLGRVQVVTKNAAMHVKEEGMAESMAKELAKWFTGIRLEGLPED